MELRGRTGWSVTWGYSQLSLENTSALLLYFTGFVFNINVSLMPKDAQARRFGHDHAASECACADVATVAGL